MTVPPPVSSSAVRVGDMERDAGRSPGRCARVLTQADALLTDQRLRVYPLILGVGFVLVLAVAWSHGGLSAVMPDFASRWTAGRLLLEGRADQLYDPVVQQALQREHLGSTDSFSWFVSPPFVALVFVPLALLPYGLACVLWAGLCVAALGAALLLLRPVAPTVLARRWPLVVLVVVTAQPVLELLGSGQDTVWILVAALVGVALLDRGHELAAGAVMATGLGKPHLVFLLPLVLLVQRRWRALVGFGTVGLALGAASLGVVGVAGVSRWLGTVGSPQFVSQVQQGQAWKGASVQSLLTSLLPPEAMATGHAWAVGAGLLLCVPLLVRARRVGRDGPEVWAVALLTLVLASPHTMVYDLVLGLPAVLVLAARAWVASTRVLLLLAFSLWWVAPTLHVLAERLPWPASVLGAPWAVPVVLALWWRIVHRGAVDAVTRLDPSATEAGPDGRSVGGATLPSLAP